MAERQGPGCAAASGIAPPRKGRPNMIEFDGPRQWRRNDWLDLMEFARPHVASLTVVLRGRLERASEPARSRAEQLATWGAGRWRRSHRWPGTEVRGGKASVLTVSLEPAVMRWLRTEAPKPFGWREPEWPEDVSFARPDGTVLFASVAHERMSWLSLLPEEAAVLERSYGRLRSKLHRVDDRVLR